MNAEPRLMQPDALPFPCAWNYDRTELVADGIVHAVGVTLGLCGGVALILHALASAHGISAVAVVVYAIGLITVLALSAAYNVWRVSPVKWLLRRFDHSAIYILIAGTYTPFLLHKEQSLHAWALLVGIWITAAVGIALKLLLPGRLDRLAVALYLLLGWSALAAYPIFAKLPPVTLILIAIGGILYTVGVAFHLWEKLRFQNAIWHAFVVVAASFHYLAVFTTLG